MRAGLATIGGAARQAGDRPVTANLLSSQHLAVVQVQDDR
jgi:hypothetical protein